MKLHPFPVISNALHLSRTPLGILLCLLAAPVAHAQGVTFDYAHNTLLYTPVEPFSGGFAYGSVAVDAKGNLFLTDTNGVEEVLALNGSIPANPVINILATRYQIPGAGGIAVSPKGDVFVSDYGAGIFEIKAVNGSIPSNPTIEPVKTNVTYPYNVAVDASGNLYIADWGNSKVEEVLAVNGSIPFHPTVKVLASVSSPVAVAPDASGNIYVDDDGAVLEILAVNGSIPANPTINTVASGFVNAYGLAVDGAGNVFFANPFNNAIKEILAVNGAIPSQPTIRNFGEDVPSPASVAVDRNGGVYLVDERSNLIPHSAVAELQLGSVNFGNANVCLSGEANPMPCSTTMTLIFKVAAGTTIGGVNVLTAGAKNLDFKTEGSDTSTTLCSAQTYDAATTCTVDVTFAPLTPGLRNGTVQIVDAGGKLLATTSVSGMAANQTITFPAIGDQYLETYVPLTATASSGLPVTFVSNTPAICIVSGDTAIMAETGYCDIRAIQSGNAEYFAATTGQTFLVHHATETIDFPKIPAQVALTPVTLLATASSGLSVTFTSNTPAVCTVKGNIAKLLTAGSCDVTATAVGNAEYFAAITGQSFLVHHRRQVIHFDAIPAQPVGTTLPLTASSDSNLPIAYASTTPTVCTVSVSSASLLTTGTCTLQASQAGNQTWFPSGPKTVSFTVQ